MVRVRTPKEELVLKRKKLQRGIYCRHIIRRRKEYPQTSRGQQRKFTWESLPRETKEKKRKRNPNRFLLGTLKDKTRDRYYGIRREKKAVEEPIGSKYEEECESVGFQSLSCKANSI